MHMIGLDGQFQDCPALLLALLANQRLTTRPDLVYQHLAPPLGAPDEMIDNQMDVVFVVLIVEILVIAHVDILQQYQQVVEGTYYWLKPGEHLSSAWPSSA